MDAAAIALHKPAKITIPPGLPEQSLLRTMSLLRLIEERDAQRLFYELYPDNDSTWNGPAIMQGLFVPGQRIPARSLYPAHLEFFDASLAHREICLMAANRGGKSIAGCYAMSCHLTGEYPQWWTGKRFNQPISAWAAGDTYETTRDILQLTLLGEVTHRDGRKCMDGHGLVPGHLLGRNTWRSGLQDLVDTQLVKHVPSGGWSFLGLRSYDQGRKAFQGTSRHVILVDEEPPMDVYNEMLVRTATVSGIVMLTFTPLSGLSEVVLSFMPADQRPDLGA